MWHLEHQIMAKLGDLGFHTEINPLKLLYKSQINRSIFL